MTRHPWFEFDSLSLGLLRPLVGYGPDFFRGTYLLESPPDFRSLPSEPVHAHNLFVHQGVEQGFLGVFSSAGVYLALFSAGGYLLLRHRRGYSAIHKSLLIALLATMAGRLGEQLIGVARVSDLTVFWVLLGVFAALPVVMAGPDTAPEQTKPPVSPFQRGRVRSLKSRLDQEGGRFWRMLLVAALVAGIGTLTWFKTLNYPQAAAFADGAAEGFRDGNSQSALSSLERAIDLSPNVSSYYERRAALYWEYRNGGDTAPPLECDSPFSGTSHEICLAQEAYAANQEWVERRPYYYRSRLAAADSALDLGSLTGNEALIDESTRLYREAAEMVPSSWPLWNRLAEVYLKIGRPEEALSPLEKSLAITGDTLETVEALRFKAAALRDLLRPRDAIAALDIGVRIWPSQALSYRDRGAIYNELGEYREALADLSQAIEIDSQHADTYFSRGVVNYNLGRLLDSLADLDKSIQLDPESPLSYNNRGLIYANLDRPTDAIEDLNEAILLDPQFALAYNNRGFIQRDIGRLDEAVADLTRAIDLDPQFAMAYYNRALAYTLLTMDALALSDSQSAIDLGFDPAVVDAAVLELRGSR
jgi:tetratricopeptide (TPR) repeat protein